MINIMTKDATLNENVPTEYQGMDRFEARKKVVADLEALGLLEKIDDHRTLFRMAIVAVWSLNPI